MLRKGREARRVPWSNGKYLTSMGKLVCRHGCSKQTLHDKRWLQRRSACSCAPWSFPHRSALDGVRLGRFAGMRCSSNR